MTCSACVHVPITFWTCSKQGDSGPLSPFQSSSLHAFGHSCFITRQFSLIRQQPYFRLRLPSRKSHYLQCVLFLCSEVTLVLSSSMEKIHDITFTVSDDECCASICSLSSRSGERRSQVHSQCPRRRTVSAPRRIGRSQPQRGTCVVFHGRDKSIIESGEPPFI